MLCGANGRIEKAGSRFIQILLSRQYTTTLTKIRYRREEQGKRERNMWSGQRSAVLLATQQSNVQYLQRSTSRYARSTATTTPTDTSRRHGTGRYRKRRRRRKDGRRRACGRSDDDGDDAMAPTDECTWNTDEQHRRQRMTG
jgi:hypothetical protein